MTIIMNPVKKLGVTKGQIPENVSSHKNRMCSQVLEG